MTQPNVHALADLTWPAVGALEADAVTLLVPLGSTEQHGPHLPFDTDSRIATAVAAGAAHGRDDLVVAPTLPFGASGEHAGFPGTLSIGTEVLQQVLIELVRSQGDAFHSAVFVNGHGGNHSGVTAAVQQLQHEGHHVTAWSPAVPGGDAHAGRTETSLMLAIDPTAVRLAAATPGNTEPLDSLLPKLISHGVQAVAPNGVLGDPTGASADEGHALLVSLIADLRTHIDARG